MTLASRVSNFINSRLAEQKGLNAPPRPIIQFEGNDVMWTPDQIDEMADQGLDTNGLAVDDTGRFGNWKKKKTNADKAPLGKGTGLI